MKKILLLIASIIFIPLSMFYYLSITGTKYLMEEVEIPAVNETIYLKNVRSGLNSDNLIISNSKGRYSYNKREIRYNWEDTFFYRVSNDTLYILCRLPVKDAPEVNSKVKIIQMQYFNEDYYNRLRDHYKELGLRKFPLDRN